MKRPIMIAALSLMHGELTAAGMSDRGLTIILAVIMTAVLAYGIARKYFFFVVLYASVFFVGFFNMSHTSAAHSFVEAIDEGAALALEGTILEVNDGKYGKIIVMEEDSLGDFIFKCRILCEPELEVNPGNRVKCYCVKKNLDTASNPGNFDEKLYYYSQGIILEAAAESFVITDNRQNEFKKCTYELKRRITELINEICTEREAGVFMAMLYGEKSYLDSEIKELYADGGISHILAISGLHISILGAGLYSVLRKVMPGRWAGAVSTVVMLLYGVMAGGSVSIVRALIMYFIGLAGKLTGRIYDIKNAVCIAGILIIIENPFCIFNSSFQLSFGSVIAIGFILPVIYDYIGVKRKIFKSLVASLTVTVINAPFVCNAYMEASLYGVILNLVVIPLMSIVVLSGIGGVTAGFVSLGLGSFFIGSGVYVLRLYEALCNLVTKLPFSKLVTGHFQVVDLIVYYAIVALFVAAALYRKKNEVQRKKVKIVPIGFSTVFVLILHFNIYVSSLHRNVVTFLDVGQGDSAVFISGGGTVFLFDCGSSSIKNVGKYRILPYLKYMGISKIDYVILSHSDSDHINGIGDILEDRAIRVKNIVIPREDDGFSEIEEKAGKDGVNIIRADDTMKIADDEAEVEIINPMGRYEGTYRDVNESGLAAIINAENRKITMLGDVGKDTELKLIEEEKLCETDVLKAAHHGSKYSSSEESLSVLKPVITIISCGEDNIYGHPHSEAVERIKERCGYIFTTYETGAVTVYLDNSDGLTYDYYRNK